MPPQPSNPAGNSLRKRQAPAAVGTGPAHTPTSSQPLVAAAKAVEARVERALLVLWDDLPAWRRDNAFILGGYRATSNSLRGSLASLGYLHNESVNIWSHLLGALVFTGGGGGYLWHVVRPRYATASTADVCVFACFFAGAFLCLGMSATYHALSNHSPAVARWGNKLDYSGIVFMIVGSYVPALYYGFFCSPALLRIYLSVMVLLGLSCLVASWFEQFRDPKWRTYRAILFVALGVSGVVPIMHGLTQESYGTLDERMGLSWVILQGALYIFGAFLYAVRWPERVSPGTFDIWGSSHQIFHVLILLAAASHLTGMAKAFDHHHSVMGTVC